MLSDDSGCDPLGGSESESGWGGVADVPPIVPQLTRRKIKPAGDFAWNILQSMSLNAEFMPMRLAFT